MIQQFPRSLIQVILQVVITPPRIIGITRGGGSSSKSEKYDDDDGDGDDSISTKHVQSSFNLPLLPALLQASILALLSASIPLAMAFTATLVVVMSSGRIIVDPSRTDLDNGGDDDSVSSLHVLAFSTHGDLLVIESEGIFDLGVWDDVFNAAKQVCCVSSRDRDGEEQGDDGVMDVEEDDRKSDNLEETLRSAIQKQVARDQSWKETLGS